MRRLCTAAFVVLFLTPNTGIAQPSVRVVGRIEGQARFKAEPINARLGQRVELTVELRGRKGRPAELPPGSEIQWLQVSPRMQHRDLPARNERMPIYANAVMFGPNHGRWLGTDTLEYDTVPLKTWDGTENHGETLLISSATPHKYGKVGTSWISAVVTLPDGSTITAPDGNTLSPLGLDNSVMRVSFRAGDTYLGWLGTYFGVPYIFGSTGPQTDRYTGTDCADALIGARRASGVRGLRYTSVTGLPQLSRPITPNLVLDESGTVRDGDEAEQTLRWGEEIGPGVLLVMDFLEDTDNQLPRAWDHAAVLVRDGGPDGEPNGVLDGTDLVRHMTTRGLADQPLSWMGLIRFRLFRWR